MKRAFQTTPETLGASAMRAQHSRLILNLLWKEQEISRADLARRTSLSRSTVSAIVNDLLNTGLVKEAHAGVSSGGRRPIILEFQDAIELHRRDRAWRDSRFVCSDGFALQSQGFLVCASTRSRTARVALEKMTMAVHAVLEADGATALAGARDWSGCAKPGRQPAAGRAAAADPSEVAGVQYCHPSRKKLQERVFVDNDANLGALAELWWAAGPRSRILPTSRWLPASVPV